VPSVLDVVAVAWTGFLVLVILLGRRLTMYWCGRGDHDVPEWEVLADGKVAGYCENCNNLVALDEMDFVSTPT
jgi:hypothetical protein